MPVGPGPGSFVQLRGRTWLVEGVTPAEGGRLAEVALACTDDDAQGEKLRVVWDAELAPRILDDADWEKIGTAATDDSSVFSAYLRTLRWNTVSAADRKLFQAPFARASSWKPINWSRCARRWPCRA